MPDRRDAELDSLDAIAAHWDEHDPAAWRDRPERYLELGVGALELGHPSLAFDILKSGLLAAPGHPELGYRAALALARGGATTTASQRLHGLIESIDASEPIYVDALSLAGRLAKDRWVRLEDPAIRDAAARDSARLYARAYACAGDYYPGVNAASMTLLAGDVDAARALANEVRRSCEASVDESSSHGYWIAATLGECFAILGDRAKAAQWYAEAVARAAGRHGDIASMRRQVRLLSGALDLGDELLEILAVPRVVVFTGHMIDAPDRAAERFPAHIEEAVAHATATALDRLDARFGYCSAACGADLIFAETMHARGGEVHVLLPFAREDFLETSVAFAGPGWLQRFDAVLADATTLRYATEEGYLGDDVLFAYNADLIAGMALLRARQLEAEAVMLGVVDTAAPGAIGGALDTVRAWEAKGRRAERIELGPIRAGADRVPGEPRSDGSPQRAPARSAGRSIEAMLFADVVGFSKLDEVATPLFFVDFLSAVAEAIEAQPIEPAFRNTWGDGLFLVYDDLRAAADSALRLRERVTERDWSQVGLPADTNIRIAMHAGPVFAARDPIIGRRNYYGSHVNRAARIEPVTTPGSVFVSEQTACLLAAAGVKEFECDYLGHIQLAKKYGTSALYRLRRAEQAE